MQIIGIGYWIRSCCIVIRIYYASNIRTFCNNYTIIMQQRLCKNYVANATRLCNNCNFDFDYAERE